METILINKSYPEYVWVTSLLLAPLLRIIILAIDTGTYWNAGLPTLFILFLFTAVVFSLPTIFLYGLAFKELAAAGRPAWTIKVILSLITACGLGFTLLVLEKLMNFGFERDTITSLLTLIGSVWFSGFMYRIRRKESRTRTGASLSQH